MEKWSWSKASRIRRIAPNGGRSRKNEIGAKRAGKGGLLQAGKIQMKWSRSKASRIRMFAPNRKVVGKMKLEQSEQEMTISSNQR